MVNLLEYKIEKQFDEVFNKSINKEIVLFCVGNYKIWYDSFGPLFAEVARKNNINCFIYGGSANPIMPDNLLEYMQFVEQKHPSALIILIDNCLSAEKKEMLDIKIKSVPSVPAGFVHSKKFGDISILLILSLETNFQKYKKYQDKTISIIVQKLQIYISNLQKNTTKSA